MEQGLKERLVGAAVLVILAVIFIPMLLDDRTSEEVVISATNIPPKPESIPETPVATDFSSRIIPLKEGMPEPEDTDKIESTGKVIPVDDHPPAPDTRAELSSLPSDVPEKVVDEAVENVGLSAWVVQLGSFSSRENAESLNKKLRDAGYRSFVEPLKQNEAQVYRVRVGPELKRSDVEAINDQLKKTMKIEGIIVNYP